MEETFIAPPRFSMSDEGLRTSQEMRERLAFFPCLTERKTVIYS